MKTMLYGISAILFGIAIILFSEWDIAQLLGFITAFGGFILSTGSALSALIREKQKAETKVEEEAE